MKKNLMIFLMLFAFTPVPGAEKPAEKTDPAALIPSTAVIYVRSPEIGKAVLVARYILKNFFPEKKNKEIGLWNSDFNKKTGLDPLDTASLAKAGVDTGRPAYFAYLASEQQSERIIIFIPVKNEKTAPLKFIDVLKKYNKDKPKLDLNPAISRYKNRILYQVLKDIFFTSLDGNLIVASSGTLLRGVIDAKENPDSAGKGGPSPLASHPPFRDFRTRTAECGDLIVYIEKDFINERYKSGQKSKEPAKEGVPNAGAALPPEIDFIEYLMVGLKKEGEGISLRFGASLKKDTPTADVFMNIFKPVVPDSLISADDALSYQFLSIDPQAFEKMCANAVPQALRMCSEYKKFKAGIEKQLDINLEKDFLPYFGGYINMAARKSKIAGAMDNFILFVPMSNEGKTETLWKAIRSAVKGKYAGDEEFGEEKIDTLASFWYKDKKENKISFIAFENGLYIGNNTEYLRSAMNGKKEFPQLPVIECPGNGGEALILLSYLKMDNESYLKALLQLLTYNVNPQVYGLINRIDSVSLTGKRSDNYFSFNLTTILLPEKAK